MSTSLGFVHARVGLVSAVAGHLVYVVVVLRGYRRLHETRALADKP